MGVMTQKIHRTSLGLLAVGATLAVAAGSAGGCGGDDDVTPSGATGTTSSSSSGGGDGGGGGSQLNCVVDGVKGPLEECDDGNDVIGDGCENDCSFSCVAGTVNGDAKCDDNDSCNGAETCSAAHTCEPGTPAADGAACGAGKVCKAGVCGDDTCGDLFVSALEDCDDGNVVDGDGCDSCKFTCVAGDPAACTPANPCEGQGTCDGASHTCSPGTPLADGASCGVDLVCKTGVCILASCGNGMIDPGEQCEPPSTPTCSIGCQNQAVCGNGTRELGEQCDDGNTTNLDGCSGLCLFEQGQRANWLHIQYGTDAYCTANGLGAAIVGGTAQNQIQAGLDDGVLDGSISIMFQTLGLDDLSGTADPAIELGVVNGSPETNGGMLAYDGTADLDWWYNADPLSLDANRIPTAKLAGSITAKVLDAGPGDLTLNLLITGSPAALAMSDVKVNISIGATSVPLTSAGDPPGHLASEQLDPALSSYASAGQPSNNGAGKLCGKVSAASLATVPAPAALTGGGLLACSENYAMTNSLLDVIVGGCTVLFIQQIKPTQPDTFNAGAPAAGSGAPYTLTANAQKAITGCKDQSNQTVDLATCLDAAAYSSFFKFAAGRVILK